MAVSANDTLPQAARPPRAMAWVLLLAAAGAVAAVGISATVILFGRLGSYPAAPSSSYWTALIGASILAAASVSLRSLRWIFLLRRAETRIPIRDAYIGYLSGFSLLFAPLLAGEIAVRALVHRSRGNVPVQTTIVVNVWERLLDLAALALLAAVMEYGAHRRVTTWSLALAMCAVLSFVAPLRRLALRLVVGVSEQIARLFSAPRATHAQHLADSWTWTTAFAASLVAWTLPAAGLWLLARTSARGLDLVDAVATYSSSATASLRTLAAGGVLVAGRQMLDVLANHGFSDADAVLTVLGVRLSTVGVSVALGVLFVVMHLRTTSAGSATHFDDIADAYDVQIPESRRHSLLDRKTALMKSVIDTYGIGRRGLDVGCGQGAYVGRMREMGFAVEGIDMSPGQVRLAARNVGGEDVVRVGSVLDIPAADASFDFIYIINVLHHLGSIDEQRQAFAELLRVLKPGGLLFVHEINTRNLLFRFYMGYVFPSLNCIDEGVERWLLAHEMRTYTDAPLVDVHYFTFLPDFVPSPVVRLLGPLERALERSRARVYSAHYMAVLRKA